MTIDINDTNRYQLIAHILKAVTNIADQTRDKWKGIHDAKKGENMATNSNL